MLPFFQRTIPNRDNFKHTCFVISFNIYSFKTKFTLKNVFLERVFIFIFFLKFFFLCVVYLCRPRKSKTLGRSSLRRKSTPHTRAAMDDMFFSPRDAPKTISSSGEASVDLLKRSSVIQFVIIVYQIIFCFSIVSNFVFLIDRVLFFCFSCLIFIVFFFIIIIMLFCFVSGDFRK